jgi:hypothetical protein
MNRYKILTLSSFLMLFLLNSTLAQDGCTSGNCTDGYGVWQWNGMVYKGEFKNGKRNGYGYYLFENGDTYIGEWSDNEKQGYGRYNYKNNPEFKYYAGEWRADKRDGMGIMVYADESVPSRFGAWEKNTFLYQYENVGCLQGDCMEGFGIYVWATGTRYEGNFGNGRRNGEGIYYYHGGSKYIGTQKDDLRHGWGTYHYINGSKYVGEWVREVKEGKGTFYSDGIMAARGIWEANQLVKSEMEAVAKKDTEPPVIKITEPFVVASRNGGIKIVVKQREIYVEGTATDDSGVKQVRTSGAVSELSNINDKTMRFEGKVALSEGQNTFWVEATDNVGNVVKEEFQIVYEPTDAVAAASDNGTKREINPKYLSEKRTALVIGNATYSNVAALRNPKNDAIEVAAKLQSLGFSVELRTDASEKEMIAAVRDFGTALKSNGGVGLFYYAGHGLQLDGENYLVPIDADIRKSSDIKYEAVELSQVLNELEFAENRLNIVILDACRDNPYPMEDYLVRGMAKPAGLSTANAPSGTYIAYSTSPGKAASDGSGEHGLYTEMLLRALDEGDGTKIEDIFKKVREYVMSKSEGLQVPWENSSIIGDFYFKH